MLDEGVMGFTASDRNLIGLTSCSSKALYNQLWITPNAVSRNLMELPPLLQRRDAQAVPRSWKTMGWLKTYDIDSRSDYSPSGNAVTGSHTGPAPSGRNPLLRRIVPNLPVQGPL
ncbi:hypothetical protein GUITHDRAFT_114498 [Guillardia theta CCMP2712]|uniref:Uncharacterized protein n=1 Tax=Guillardia theta (strain CCMP2712) TaxID=905079 RepID=L1ISS3_GUITC|nr:hypothetical protein GUITHDRAFT_114498 [Guillardia theta CCMP2712]EKX39296.1 hypothetical protein GUITHDRAFT_114498 [Guillardia theta CCMP2712]|eukprot:XP_005826276.1 hypothetical protein GUITHDRAFT_114498 [Guillardia theta CCMP2712]